MSMPKSCSKTKLMKIKDYANSISKKLNGKLYLANSR